MPFLGKSVLAGCIFGFALAFAGVTSPAVIITQLNLASFHMLKVFISATAISAVVIHILRLRGYADPTPSPPASLGLLGKYDGNIIGGLLLGLGMGQAGACPGTLIPQLATGNILAIWVVLGAATSGSALVHELRIHLPLPSGDCGSGRKEADATTNTVYELVSVSPGVGLALFEMFCLSVVGSLMWFEAEQSIWGDENIVTWNNLYPVVGGLAIGLTQGASLLLTGRPLSASAVYELPNAWLRRLNTSNIKYLLSIFFHRRTPNDLGISLKNNKLSESDRMQEQKEIMLETDTNQEQKPTSTPDVEQLADRLREYEAESLPHDWEALLAFALGSYFGARITTHLLPSFIFVPAYEPCSEDVPCESGRAGSGNLHVGGTLMILGSRIAGGCTSGHGISGMSMGAKSSFVTVTAMFAGGILGVRVLGREWGFGWVSDI